MAPSEGKFTALRWILLATAVAGALGYLIQVAAPRLLADSAYVAFSVIWSTVYLGVAAMSGVQQEVSRGSRRSTDHAPNTVLRTFTLCAAGAVILAVLVLSVWLSLTTLPMPLLGLASVLTVAFIGYLVNAVLSGVLYGLQLWRGVALITILDAVLRTVFLALAFVLAADPVWLGFGIAFPFGLSFGLAWIVLRRRVVGRFTLDVDIRSLSRNVLSTVGAAACSGVMISGLPLLLGVTSATVPASVLGSLIMAINLTRAPIVVPVMALQSYLISAVFRDRGRIRATRLFGILGAALGVMTVLSSVAFLIGPWLITTISSGAFEIEPILIAVVVFSAGLVALMCITGPALVATGRHSANVVGWAVAAALTAVCLLMPLPFDARSMLALTLPAVVGLVIHSIALLRPASTAAAASPAGLPA